MNTPVTTTVAAKAAAKIATPPPEVEESPESALASLCKAAGDELRLRVLRLLRHDAMGVSELCEVLDVRQPALSHHLKLLSSAGLLDSQRDGNHIFYRRRELPNDEPFAALQHALFGAADALVLDATTLKRQEALQKSREANSAAFFQENIQHFREQQDLIAAPERYAAAVDGLLDLLPAEQRLLALEVGPGDGWLLPRLADQFERVVALDNASAMLVAAQRTVSEAGVENVEFVLGDTTHEKLGDLAANLAVMNMVLHHTPDPEATLRETAGTLASEGALLVTELCEHQQGWARENCGDLWLGFAPEQIDTWAESAGLRELASSYLGQRNGFKLQLRLFKAVRGSD